MIQLFNFNNVEFLKYSALTFDLIYADYMYEDKDFKWVWECWDHLKKGGIFIAQTDWHSVAELKVYIDTFLSGSVFINWCIYINDWGGTPRKGFPRKHDDILIYSNSEDFYWSKEEIEIPKKTAGTAFDKKGTGLKTPCDVFYDHVSFSTMSSERIKFEGKRFKYQKPLWLMDRLLRPFTKEGDLILEFFGGTFSACRWAKENNRSAIGLEENPEIFSLSSEWNK